MEFQPLLRRCLLIAGIGLVTWPAGADFDAELKALHDKATAFRTQGDFAAVEQLRRDRRRLLATADKGSPWAAGIASLRAVAGEKAAAPASDSFAPLDHRAAYSALREVWKTFSERPSGEVFGDLATEMFVVAQRAAAEDPGALTDGSPTQVASPAELREALTTARDRDPCQAGIAPMLAYLDRTVGDEAFLRLESRPEMKKRLDQLRQSARKPGEPLLPWHAAVELMKSRELVEILRDRERSRLLAPTLAGFDGRSSPFRLIGGRQLLVDLSGPGESPKPVFIRPDGAGGWLGKPVIVVWRYPAAGEQPVPGSADAASILGGLQPAKSLELGFQKFGVFTPSVPDVHRLIQGGARRLAVTTVARLLKTTSSVSSNDPKLIDSILDDEAVPGTDPDVAARIEAFASQRDKFKHALVDLCSAFNPVIIVADEKGLAVEPGLLPSTDGRKRLVLEDGRMLTVVGTPVEECGFEYDEDGVKFHAPLLVEAIPRQLLLATEAGTVAHGILRQAGYDESESLGELLAGINAPKEVPQKVSAMLKNLAKKQRRDAASVGKEMLTDRNWTVQQSPMADLADRYDRLGFRYLAVGSRRLVTHADLFGPPSGGQAAPPMAGPQQTAPRPLEEPAVAVRSLATAAAVDPTDLCSPEIYDSIQNRIASSLANTLAWHPSMASLDAARSIRPAVTVQPQQQSPQAPAATASRGFPEWIAADEADRGMLDKLLEGLSGTAMAARDDRAARLNLFLIHLQSIRGLATASRWPEAMAGYRELIEHLDRVGGGFQRVQVAVSDRQPSAEEVKRLLGEVATRLEDALLGLIAEAEQGAVLRAVGHVGSAAWLWRRCIDRHRLCLLPLYDRDIAEASRLEEMLPETITNARARIGAVLEQIEFEAGKAGPADDHVGSAIGPHAGESRTPFVEWVAAKLAARTTAPRDLWQGGSSPISPLQMAPAAYSKERGFYLDLATMLPDGIGETAASWKDESAAASPSGQRAALNLFLVGWYWLEQGKGALAREAFAAAARHAAAADADPTAALVSRRNRMMLLLAAESAQGRPAGAPWTGSSFLDALMAEAAAWQRDWSRAGQIATHAAGERSKLEALAGLLRKDGTRQRDTAGCRFFTCDNQFEHGPLPDRLVADAREWKVFQSVPREPDSRPKPKPAAPPAPPADPKAPPPPPAPGDEPKPLDFAAFLQAAYKTPVAPDPQVMALIPISAAQ
ncbi:MAG: hypothetical protein ACKOEX_07480 [Planctomycetia bacterium]